MSVEMDSLSLKWGTLKSWRLHSDKGVDLLRRYSERPQALPSMRNRQAVLGLLRRQRTERSNQAQELVQRMLQRFSRQLAEE